MLRFIVIYRKKPPKNGVDECVQIFSKHPENRVLSRDRVFI